MKNKLITIGLSVLALAILLVSCSHNEESTSTATSTSTKKEPITINVLTHESFDISEEVVADFERAENIKVNFLTAADVGTLVSQLVLTKDNPIAHVVFGIDNTFIQKALDENIFQSYKSPALKNVNEEFLLNSFVTPVDYGDVCLNYWKADFNSGETNLKAPTNLDDLIKPEYKNKFVTPNPETSSPGLAFLLATIAKYGESETDGWKSYWRKLRENGVSVTSGWSEAYFGEFIAGGGTRSIVTSYASSPVAAVVFSEEEIDTSPTGVVKDACFRQVEYAGIIKGLDAAHEEASKKVIDWFLSKAFQEDFPLKTFVYPVNNQAQPPAVFVKHAVVIENPLSISPERIAEMRDEWTDEWVNIVLR